MPRPADHGSAYPSALHFVERHVASSGMRIDFLNESIILPISFVDKNNIPHGDSMKTVSILNHVLGPVMRGPSSSHTAGSFHIGCMARSLLGGIPQRAVLAFDPEGSFAVTYEPQGADRGFAMGLMNRPLTDESFFTALQDAPGAGMHLQYQVRSLADADHPNTVDMDLTSADGTNLKLVARSIGGGEVEITRVDGRPVLFNGSAFETLVEVPAGKADAACVLLADDGALLASPIRAEAEGVVRLDLPAPNRAACRPA